MPHAIDWSRLDAAAYRVSVKRSVRQFAWRTGILAVVVWGCGIAAASLPLALVGLVLVWACTWNYFRPAVTGLLVDGSALILTGLGLLGLSWSWFDGSVLANGNKAMFTALPQLIWGVRRLASYRTARLAADDPQAIAALETIVTKLSKRDAKTDEAVVLFHTGRFHHHHNRLGLFAEGMVALLEGQAVRLDRRADVWIEPRGTTSLGRSLKVELRMGELQLAGEVPTAHLERFEHWKTGMAVPRSAAA